MADEFINLTPENIANEHLCCAIADKKHQNGVDIKREWLASQLSEGHIFRKLNTKGKVFIEYTPLEYAWVPLVGTNYLYIYCLWVAGSFKGHGYGNDLITYCIADAQRQGKSGICVLSSKQKKPYLSDKKFLAKYGFEVVDNVDDYEILALSFDGTIPQFTERAKQNQIENETLTIYYSLQCPYIPNCIEQAQSYCEANHIPLDLIRVDTLEKAKALPCVFNNWAVFYKGAFSTVTLLNEAQLKKILAS